MGRRQSYTLITCPRCGRKRVRLWADGRISTHLPPGDGYRFCRDKPLPGAEDFDRAERRGIIKPSTDAPKGVDMGEGEQVPAPGRVVHYVEPLRNGRLTCRPALVLAVGPRSHDDGFTLLLVVFLAGDLPAYTPEQFPAHVGGAATSTAVAYHDAQGRTAYTWHWPEKITTEIELAALVR